MGYKAPSRPTIMTKNRQTLRRVHSPVHSPRRHNSSLRKKALVRRISGEVQFGSASKANLKVVVRVRPQNQREEEKGAKCVVNVLDEHMLVLDPSDNSSQDFFFKGTKTKCRDLSKRQPLDKKFVFERVFGGESTNAELYESTAHPLIETLLQGYNCSVFAYGATGAGKTFTMLGRPECPGIISLTLQELYQRLDELKGHKQCEVAVSYLEVYNETVRDLLKTGKCLALQEMGQQVMVPGLSLHKPSDAEELLQMLAQGNSNRTQHATDANAESSRSHAVFQIFVRQQDLDASAKAAVTISKLSMIDLAGSERGAATGFRGMRFKEGSSINKSLLALGNCINALADGQRHIPYRDSKLTRLLKDSLGGNCKSVMIAAMSPASTSFEDTYNTLRYAERAKTIRTTIRNNVKNVDQHVSDYIKIVAGLREEVANLREKVKEYEEKEKQWETERSELVRGVAPFTPHHGMPEEVRVERHQEEEISEAELNVQKQLQDVGAEQKALRQELLQLEGSYKATDLKLRRWIARLARVKVVAFASSRLDKTINKCERTIHALEKRLCQIVQCINTVKNKVAANTTKIQEIQEALVSFGSDCLSTHSKGLVEKHEANIALRDSHLFGEHLQTLLKEDFKEQNVSEQLIHVLLGAVRDLYLQSYQKDPNCPEVRAIFQNVVDGLNETKLAWADQQSVSEKNGLEGTRGVGEPIVAQLYADQFTMLPSLTTPIISPTITVEPLPCFRKSIMMANVNGSVHPPHQPPDIGNTSMMNPTASVSRTPSPVNLRQPQSTQKENLNTTTTITSPVLFYHLQPPQAPPGNVDENSAFSASAGARLENQLPTNITALNLNTTSDRIPSASRLSSITVNKLHSPYKPLNTISDISASEAFLTTITPAKPFSSISDPPSASKLSSIAPCSSTTKTLNTTIDLHSPLLLSTTAPVSILTTALSDTKALNNTSQLSSRDTHPAVSTELPSNHTTANTISAPAVVRKLFEGEREGLNCTFSIAQAETVEDPGNIPLPSEPHKDALSRSPKITRGSSASRSPLISVSNRTSHTNLFRVPEKQSVINKGLRGIANRRGMSHNQTFTPGKTLGKETGMRRSVSTPSLTHSSNKPSTTTKKKLKGFGGTLQRTTSFLRGRGTNQENVPPIMRRPSNSGLLGRSSSPTAAPSRQPRSPGGLLGKA